MKTLRGISILLAVSVALPGLGCRDTSDAAGSDTSNDRTGRTAAPVTTESADLRPTVVCFGDSLTAGYGTDPGESYPDVLQKRLDSQGYTYRVVNSGVSGNTTKDGLERLARVAAKKPKIVVLEFGGNDGLRGLPLEQTKDNIATMIEQLQASGAQVALAGITLPPDYGKDYIAKLDAIYPALARQYKLPLLPFLLKGVYGVPGGMQADATHATAAGNKVVAANVEGLIKPLLKK